jgi:anti-sigma factor RsiW
MSGSNDVNELSATHRSATRRGERSDCPTPEELARAVSGELPAPTRMRLAQHLASCSDCAEEFRLAAALEPFAAKHGAAERPAFPAMRRFAWAAAVVVGLGIGISVWQLTQPAGGEPVRAPATGTPFTVVAPVDGAKLGDAPIALSWRLDGQPRAGRLELFDATLAPLWRSSGAAPPPFQLPADVRQRISARGGRVYWRVVFAGELGEERSPLAGFTVRSASGGR